MINFGIEGIAIMVIVLIVLLCQRCSGFLKCSFALCIYTARIPSKLENRTTRSLISFFLTSRFTSEAAAWNVHERSGQRLLSPSVPSGRCRQRRARDASLCDTRVRLRRRVRPPTRRLASFHLRRHVLYQRVHAFVSFLLRLETAQVPWGILECRGVPDTHR